MTPADFENRVIALFEPLMAQERLRHMGSSHEPAFSTVLVGNEHAGVRVLLEWRELHVQVMFFRCVGGQPPAPPADLERSSHWLSLEELAEVGRIHPLEVPLLTASHFSDEGLAEVTPQDVVAYLADAVPPVKAVGTPWFRGQLDSFEDAVRARNALLAEPELSGERVLHLQFAPDVGLPGRVPAFVVGLLDACAPLSQASWRDVWYASTPRHLAMAMADPRREIGVEVRMRWPRPVEVQVELLLLEEGRPPALDRKDRRVACRWAIEARGGKAPQLERRAGVGVHAFVSGLISTLVRVSPEFLSGDGSPIREAQAHRQRLEEALGAEFR